MTPGPPPVWASPVWVAPARANRARANRARTNRARTNRDSHAGAERVGGVVTERFAFDEASLLVQRPGRSKGLHRPCLEADTLVARAGRERQDVSNHRSPHPLAPGRLAGVHRFELGVRAVQPPEGAHADEPPFTARGEEGD